MVVELDDDAGQSVVAREVALGEDVEVVESSGDVEVVAVVDADSLADHGGGEVSGFQGAGSCFWA